MLTRFFNDPEYWLILLSNAFALIVFIILGWDHPGEMAIALAVWGGCGRIAFALYDIKRQRDDDQ